MSAARPLCVLSVGRSGTSLAARALEALGVDFGAHETMLPATEWNRQGFWEQHAVMELNDDILSALGGSLWEPPASPPPGWEHEAGMATFAARAAELVASLFAHAPRWGFKDPRTALTLPLWRRVVGPMDYLICLRSPAEVAASLRVGRPDLTTDEVLWLWTHTNAQALRQTAGERRAFVYYEEWFADPHATAAGLAAFVHGTPEALDEAAWERVRSAFDPTQRRQRVEAHDHPDVPTEARVLDGLLRQLADRDDPALEALAVTLGDAHAARLERERASARRLAAAREQAERAEARAAVAAEEAGSLASRLVGLEALVEADGGSAGAAGIAAGGAVAVAAPPAPALALPVAVPDEVSDADRALLEEIVEDLGPWLQGPFPLSGGITAGGPWRCDERWGAVAPLLGRLRGERTLDVGCNAGFDAFMLRALGAGHVLGVEPFGFFDQAAFLEQVYQTGIELRRIGWQALDPETHGRFDVVHCGGLLFREPHVVRLLLKLRAMVAEGGRLLLGTVVADGPGAGRARFVAGTVAGDSSWWWVPDTQALHDLLRATGFEVSDEVEAGEAPLAPFACSSRYVMARAVRAPDEALLAADLPSDEAVTRFPIGHFYSPAPDPRELAEPARHAQIWPAAPRETVGIDWREDEQLALLERMGRQPRVELARAATADPTEYFADNDQYPPLDAWLLAGMLQELRPRRMVEVGSGFSTLLSARINRERLDGAMDLTCIEPFPRGFLLDGIPGVGELRVEKIQDTPLALFETLGDRDVLFIDSSHVVKTGSDVWWLFSEVLPRLAPGVRVHVHDIFLPGDYPESWVMEGWGWNEIYLVQAFLAFNRAFAVELGAYHLWHRHTDALVRSFPGFADYAAARGGGSLWLRRTD